MEFGFISIDWGNESLLELAEELLTAGFTWVEVHYPRYTKAAASFGGYEKTNRALIRRYHPHVSLHLPAGDINPASFNRQIRQESLRQLKEAMDFGQGIGASLAVMHPGELREADFPEDGRPIRHESARRSVAAALTRARKLNVDAVAECADYAEARGMQLTVENLFGTHSLIKTPDQAWTLLRDVGHRNVHWTVDVGHAIRAGIAPVEFVKTLGEEVVHCHLNDNDGSCDLHLPLGQGVVDWVAWARAVEKVGYRGAFVFEISSSRAQDFIESRSLIQNALK